jgi:hypothetical protein
MQSASTNTTHAHEFPRCSGELSEAWLTRVLHAAGVVRHARVRSMGVQPLGGGAADGQTLRIVPRYDLEEAGAPRSLVLKLTPRGSRELRMRRTLGSAERELRFYAELAADTPLLTTRCLHAEQELSTGCYALLLEEACGHEGMASLQNVEVALQELARLHAAHWNQPRAIRWAHDDPGALRDRRRDILGALEQLRARLGDELPGTVASATELYAESLDELAECELGAPLTVLHGDPSPRHWLMRGERATLVDWQALAVGSPMRDVARLLASALPAVLRISQERRLVALYHGALRWHGIHEYRLSECHADYRRGLLHASARAVLMAARGQERAGQAALDVEGSIADQLARMELALQQNEVLPIVRADLGWRRTAA